MKKRARDATRPKAVVLLSGGLDSTTCLAVALRDGFEPHALSVDYGQRHKQELRRARRLADALGASDHKVVKVDLSAFGGVGVNAIDYSGYPDCRPEFIRAFERLAGLATKAGVEGAKLRIHTPLQKLGKADIVRLGTSLGVPYKLTLSCYDPARGKACGRCDACTLRRHGFEAAGVPDPTVYVSTRS